jgi:hypothetical protein
VAHSDNNNEHLEAASKPKLATKKT